MNRKKLTAISLFSSAGIGDLALKSAGVEVLVANELLPDRASLFEKNFPECDMLSGDIRHLKHSVIAAALRRLNGDVLDVLFATPPCQGMSKNGRGKLLSMIRAGERPPLDERNTLILEVIDIALALRPRLIVLENVPEMRDTVIEFNGDLVNILDLLKDQLAEEYVGSHEIVEFADYGVPQRRKRLITVFSRDDRLKGYLKSGSKAWLPQRTHAQHPTLLEKPWVSVLEAIGDLETLDAVDKKKATSQNIFYHRVPVLDADKYFWVSNTPAGKGAFDNQCVNPSCGFDRNSTHGSSHVEGINQANKATPINCEACGELLPRPWVYKSGQYRIMSGFTSAYKRMRGDLPASALTRNLSYACSDQKLHPTQNRVLSIHEAFILHTINLYDYSWCRNDGKKISDKTVREVIGESIPPAGLEKVFRHILEILDPIGSEKKIHVHENV